MTKTLDDYRQSLRVYESHLVEDDGTNLDELMAGIAWLDHAVRNYDPDPMAMVEAMADRTILRAKHDPEKSLAEAHTRKFRKKAMKGQHYEPS